MRKIKFRAYEESLCKFKYISSSYDLEYFSCNAGYGPNKDISDFGWDQFTGLLDSKGNEIYEGDIVCDGRDIDFVRFEDGGFYPFSIAGWGDPMISKNCTVIGNIHKNKELLVNDQN